MNILIVDDLVSVVNGIIKGVDWDALGILGIYKAHNVYEAKVLINNLNIDILLTDIEMPGESGLDLTEWVKENGFDTECIFMSSHADFEYARRAIRSGGFRYVLLPCPYEEIQETIHDAMEKLKNDREQRKLTEYARIVSEDICLEKVLFGEALNPEKSRDAVEKLIELKRFSKKTQGYLCYLRIGGRGLEDGHWDAQLMDFTLNNVISELMAPLQQKIILYQKNIREYWFFCSSTIGNGIIPGEIFRRQIEMIDETMKGILRLDAKIIYEVCENIKDLFKISQDVLGHLPSDQEYKKLKQTANNNQWLHYYNTGVYTNLKNDVASYLEKEKSQPGLSFQNVCMRLHTDLIQLMYKYLNQYNDSVFSVFETQAMFDRYIHAYQNPEDLIWLAGKIQNYIGKRQSPEMEADDPVKEVIRYVQEHISQDIKRNDLADYVHLNTDYLSRIFKREKGMTLNDYIIYEKMNVAQNLLRTTKLPVSLIAVKVGYSNFSYFSKLYKKIHGCSPAQEREKIQ